MIMGPPPRKPLNSVMFDVMAAAAIQEDVTPVKPDRKLDLPVESETEIVRSIPDGRSLRATGRTHQFATRIKEETHDHIKELARHQKITIGELLERMTDVFWVTRELTADRKVKIDDVLRDMISARKKDSS